MSWTTIARREYAATGDSRAIRWLLALLAGACILSGYLYPVLGSEPYTTKAFVGFGFLTGSIDYLLPLIGVFLGYGAIVTERTSGQLTLLLSLPYSRRDLVVGKLVGRSLAFATTLVAALAVAGALVAYPFGSLSLGWYLAFVALTVLYGVIFTGIATAVSILTRSKHLATAGSFGAYGLFVPVWGAARSALRYGLESIGLIDGALPDPALFLFGLNPVTLYDRLVAGFFVDGGASAYAESNAWYLSEWLALPLFLAWVVVPVALGHLRFRNTDL
ncbi:ABC-2 type transporter [Haloterrigena turkmenica DSM 5511]|uniref:ABC-2 type transporter n=1 Tax=Haloterrigena turkmenica (strain ATCC 51198 / DSM 5511 / JCM 9101 / NCIMB 13204 / VKM B-1734 / 4k) TaxID=543526 RepID=D2RU60_HALTV|nr:ABC transporter permease subunit [Haloterrigena turkmenica]ADB59129.1 ABC-2 type transporter [Haloterrigena turkmenica DSM 5511]